MRSKKKTLTFQEKPVERRTNRTDAFAGSDTENAHYSKRCGVIGQMGFARERGSEISLFYIFYPLSLFWRFPSCLSHGRFHHDRKPARVAAGTRAAPQAWGANPAGLEASRHWLRPWPGRSLGRERSHHTLRLRPGKCARILFLLGTWSGRRVFET